MKTVQKNWKSNYIMTEKVQDVIEESAVTSTSNGKLSKLEHLWAVTCIGTGLSKGWPLKVLYFGTYPVPSSFGTCHQPATQECQVLTIQQMGKRLHLFIFSVIMFILSALWFFTLSRSSSLFLVMFPDLYYKEKMEEVWLSYLRFSKNFNFSFVPFQCLFLSVVCPSVWIWIINLKLHKTEISEKQFSITTKILG